MAETNINKPSSPPKAAPPPEPSSLAQKFMPSSKSYGQTVPPSDSDEAFPGHPRIDPLDIIGGVFGQVLGRPEIGTQVKGKGDDPFMREYKY
ncbi:hypothetical protein Syun_008447 [Stephania yunnanensis]|uniref:Uncharacterized protein n=1 Tax=Stephania yunnanensis TaxID=152371 RepID=A0AAP0KEC3_9MAGN